MLKSVEDIERAVAELPQAELEKFRVWYETFDSVAWDKRIEKDIEAGKFDIMAEAAIADHKAGKTTKL